MKQLRLALALMIVFVALASWWKRSHRTASFTAPAEACGLDCVDSHGTVSAMTTSPVDGRPMAVVPVRVLSAMNQAVVRDCLAKDPSPTRSYHRSSDAENILRDLGATSGSTMINVHVRRHDGREERLHVEPHDPDAQAGAYTLAGQDIRVFDVDREGLPIVRVYPAELKLDSMKHVVDSFVGDDAVSFRERRSHQTFAGGNATTVETDGRVTSLQLNFGRNALGCALQSNALTCTCL